MKLTQSVFALQAEYCVRQVVASHATHSGLGAVDPLAETEPDEPSPDETVPDETVPDEMVPDDALPDDPLPDDPLPDEATPASTE
jgi:hypothetical protein